MTKLSVVQPDLEFTVEGPRNVRTDPESGLRFYTWKGIEYPSVTTVRRMAGLPFALHQWALTKVIDRVVNEHTELHAKLGSDIAEARKWMRAASTEERDRAGDRGKRLHFAVENDLPPDADVEKLYARQKDFLAATDADILLSERQVWSPTWGYAGTIDAVGDITVRGKRVRAALDWKTGKNVYIEHALQLAAYVGTDFIGETDVIDPAATKILRGVSRLCVVHLSDDGWELVDFEPTPTLWDAWLGLLDFATFVHRHADIATIVRAENSLSSRNNPNTRFSDEPVVIEAMLKPSRRGAGPMAPP